MKVPTSRRLVTSSMTSPDVILEASQYSKSSHAETKTQHNYPCRLFSTHYRIEYSVKINSFGLELWEKKHLA